jgi:CBS domain-containing protein
MNTTLNVHDLMQIRVHVVPSKMPLVELEQEFINKRVSGFPVVDDDQLVGVVSRSDIVRQLDVERQLAENTSDFYWDRAGFHEEPAESMHQIASRVGQRIEDLHVRDLMSRHLIAVSADDSLTVLAQRFLERHIHRVLVVEHGRLVGIVSALDLVKLFADKRVEVPPELLGGGASRFFRSVAYLTSRGASSSRYYGRNDSANEFRQQAK